jgi:hypothetical protein
VELLCLVDFSALDFIYRRSGEGLPQGSVRRRSGDDLRLGCVLHRSVVPLKRSSEEVLRRSSGDHLAILDPTGYLGIWADLDAAGVALFTTVEAYHVSPGLAVGEFAWGCWSLQVSFCRWLVVLHSDRFVDDVACGIFFRRYLV